MAMASDKTDFTFACSNSERPDSAKLEGISSRIECPVCCEIFRSPKCLNCGHSVCDECCHKLKQFGGTVPCPVCRHVTDVPPGGLPTNFALQDLIQHCQNNDGETKRYQCVTCGRSCSADEAWISNTKSERNDSPRCFRCIIVSHSSQDSATKLPSAMESISDTFKRRGTNLANLKRRMELFSKEQREWTANVRSAAAVMKARVGDIVNASQFLTKATLEDVDKMNNDFQLLNIHTDVLNVPQSLEDLNTFDQSIKDTSGKLDQLAEARLQTMTRANVALNSLAIGLDCLLNAGEEMKMQSGRIDKKLFNQDKTMQTADFGASGQGTSAEDAMNESFESGRAAFSYNAYRSPTNQNVFSIRAKAPVRLFRMRGFGRGRKP